jgi:uncharacterized membrane protein YhaH (DUF805 family)
MESKGIVRALFSFKGRLGRAYFWGWLLFYVAAHYCVSYFTTTAAMNQALTAGLDVDQAIKIADSTSLGASFILSLVLLWPSLAVSVKRWHDVDKCGWWVLVNIIPVAGWFISIVYNGFVSGTRSVNRYGDPAEG